MPTAMIKGLPMLGSDDSVKQLKTRIRKSVKSNKGKLTSFSVRNEQLSLEIDNQSAFDFVCKQLRKIPGVSLTTTADPLEALVLEYASAATPAASE